MKINKLSIWLVVLLALSFAVSAIPIIDYNERCDWIRPATEFRAEKVFSNIGIFGRLSDGSLTCFLPRHRHRISAVEEVVLINDTKSEPICNQVQTTCNTWNYEEVCETPICHTEQTTCKDYDTIKKWYKDHCQVSEHNNCLCTNYFHIGCHSHTTTICDEWNYKTVCASPVCHT
jgi:hypothetical protein